MTTTCSTCTYCGEVVYGSPEDLADPLLDHWKEQCPDCGQTVVLSKDRRSVWDAITAHSCEVAS